MQIFIGYVVLFLLLSSLAPHEPKIREACGVVEYKWPQPSCLNFRRDKCRVSKSYFKSPDSLTIGILILMANFASLRCEIGTWTRAYQ